ncbi:MAG: prepilin-type N-terminal cleavage/methylation domain-containing protein [Candidatus Brocadiae bacterium]|nr:prepilin-type N-terminal cleavage/methylation domain-containing protein [Candidatus Brocadiia bacterium]
MRRHSSGFTLLEMLVVIGVIGFLAAALVVAAVGLKARANIEKTSAMVRRLDTGCEAYHTRFQDYPGNYAKGAVPSISDDVTLYEYLAKPLVGIEGYTTAGAPKKKNLPPFVEISPSEVVGDTTATMVAKIIDAWQKPILYKLPGSVHGTNYPDHSKKFDIRSLGGDGVSIYDDLNPEDDVCNWTYDRK